MKLIKYAKKKEKARAKTVIFFDFNSLLMVTMLERQGIYNKENTTNEIAAGIEKLAKIPPEEWGKSTERLETIISLEPTPVINEEVACQFPKPKGENSGEMTPEITAIMLSFISFA